MNAWPYRSSNLRSTRSSLALRIAVGGTALAAFASGATAQTWLRKWDGAADSFFGRNASSAGDLDGDGLADVIVNERTDAAGHSHAIVYSSRTGASILDVDVGTSFTYGDDLSAFTDVDGDGTPEVLFGSIRDHAVRAYSGATGALLWQAQSTSSPSGFGFSIDVAGDFDGDGILDVVVGDPWDAYTGKAYALSGRDGTELFSFSGFDGGGQGGLFVSGAGDLDGDGVPDWVATAPTSGAYKNGAVHFLSGADGSEIDRIDGYSYDRLGFALAVGPDTDGDGVDDIVVGTSFDDGWSDDSAAWLVSGADRTILHQWNLHSGALGYGEWLATPGDLDGDGRGDVVFSDTGGVAFLYSGATYALLAKIDTELPPNSPHDSWWFDAVEAGDADGDGVGDLVLRMENGDGLRVRLWSISSAPFAEAAAPFRGRFDGSTAVTVTGQNFTKGGSVAVAVDGHAASNVSVFDDATLTCVTPPLPRPGRKQLTVSSTLGGRPYGAEFLATPVITREGVAELGATVTLHFLVEAGDDAFGIYGLAPGVSIVTPPFVGELGVLPFLPLFLFRGWIADAVDLQLDVPDDPALAGLDVLFQELSGPRLIGKPKSGAWSDVELLPIR